MAEVSIETRRKMSEAHTGFRHTDETRRKLSEMRRGERNPFYGKKHRPETINGFRKRMKLRHENKHGQYDINPRLLKNFSETEAAYLAAMIDGEGSITHHYNRPVVSVFNTDLNLMNWLVEKIGRAYRRHGKSANRPERKPCWAWDVASAADVHYVLTRVRPFLIIKRMLAETVITELRAKYGNRLDG
jgi:hypothetical protein